MLTKTDPLGRELHSLAVALIPHNIPVIIGGGYGLLLRQQYLQQHRFPTLRAVPEARSTQDLDLFLSLELITNAQKMIVLRDVLHTLGYQPVEEARFYQFSRSIKYEGEARSVKIDLLAPPPEGLEREKVKMDSRRIRPKEATEIHAHMTPEAFAVGENILSLPLKGDPLVNVGIPHPFVFLILKLFAYRDRRNDKSKDYGYYHTFDLYRIVAMMTEEDVIGTKELYAKYANHEIVVEARSIVEKFFTSEIATGIIALREHSRIVDAGLTREDVLTFARDIQWFLSLGEV